MGLSWLMLCANAHAQGTFLDLDLKDVLDLEITSVSKKPQTVSKAAAAVFVITGDDIRRMGAQTIPDALRMAPGIEVAQISASSWAVTARGFNGRFANKLLVLVDGRTVFSPSFSGVFWDVQDTVLADIERIEVIRGPGGATWGANAVNGVVNIITKSAAATQGGLLEASTGTAERGTLSVRYGGKLEDVGYWRLYAKGFEREGLHLKSTGNPGFDDWRQQRIGGRADLNPSTADAVTLQAELYQGRHGESAVLSNPSSAGFFALTASTQALSGGHLLVRWQRELADGNSLTVQSYLDHTLRDWPAHAWQRVNTFDTDVQYRLRVFNGHDLVMGMSYRSTHDDTALSTTGIAADTLQLFELSQASITTRTWSALVQDDITLKPKTLVLTLGAQLERYGKETAKASPNMRLRWTPTEDQTFWATAGKANRTPSRADSGGLARIILPTNYTVHNRPLPLPAFLQVSGALNPEARWAYEIGWKQRWAPGLTTDLSAYIADYSQSSYGTARLGLCRPGLRTVAVSCYYPPSNNTLPLTNYIEGQGKGVEISADWQASRQHRLQASLTRFAMSIPATSVDIYTPGSSPLWSGSLRWSYSPSAQTELDIGLRQSSRLTNVAFGQSVPGYQAVDMRWAWRSSPKTQWELVGRNLLGRHQEFVSETGDTSAALLGPTLNVGVRLQF
jgi:iron complex outermembrane receptor protein